MKFKENDLVLTIYGEYPPWPSKVAPDAISEELQARSNKKGTVVMFYGDELTYGIISDDENVLAFDAFPIPPTADKDLRNAYKMAKENKFDFPPLDPITKKEQKNKEKWYKKNITSSKKEPILKKENNINNIIKDSNIIKDNDIINKDIKVMDDNIKSEEKEEKEENNMNNNIKDDNINNIISNIKDDNNINKEEIIKKEDNNNNIKDDNINIIKKEEEKEKEDNIINIKDDIKNEEIIKEENNNINTINSTNDDDDLERIKRKKYNNTYNNTLIPGLITETEESVYKKIKKNKSLFLRSFLKRTKKRKYIKIKKAFANIIIKYPNNTLQSNKAMHKVELMDNKSIINGGLITSIINVFLMHWDNDPLELRKRSEKILKKIFE